eukprot:1158862-Pelagomonas_calceolata.AAC.8
MSHGLQNLQPPHCEQRAAGHLLRLPRQPTAAGDLPPCQGPAQDSDHVLLGLRCCLQRAASVTLNLAGCADSASCLESELSGAQRWLNHLHETFPAELDCGVLGMMSTQPRVSMYGLTSVLPAVLSLLSCFMASDCMKHVLDSHEISMMAKVGLTTRPYLEGIAFFFFSGAFWTSLHTTRPGFPLQVTMGFDLQPGSLDARPAQLFQLHKKYP